MALSHFLQSLVALVGALDIETLSNRMIQIEIHRQAHGRDKDTGTNTNASKKKQKRADLALSHFLHNLVAQVGALDIETLSHRMIQI